MQNLTLSEALQEHSYSKHPEQTPENSKHCGLDHPDQRLSHPTSTPGEKNQGEKKGKYITDKSSFSLL